MCDTLGSKGQHQNALQNHPQGNKAFHSKVHQGLLVLLSTMFALSVMCNLTIKKKSTHEVSVLMRAELSNKVLGRVECKKQWSSMEEFSVFLQRQGATMLGCSKAMPLSFLRMKVDNTIVSLSCFDNLSAILDHPDKLQASIDSCEFVTDLCWDEGAYDELCASMLTKFQSFDYNVLNGRAVLDCTVVQRVDGAGFFMPNCAYPFEPTELVLRMNDVWLCHFAFAGRVRNFESLQTLRIKGGMYIKSTPCIDLMNFQNLQELDVEEPYVATSFDFRLRPTLRRLRISKFGLKDVPLQIKDLPNLVELDLSNNDLQSLPA